MSERTTDDLFTAQVTISALREDLAGKFELHDGDPLQALKSHLGSEDALYDDVLVTLVGVVWRLLSGEQRDDEHTDTEKAEAMALAYYRGRDKMTVDILSALRGAHAKGCECRAHALIEAVNEVADGSGTSAQQRVYDYLG